MRVEAAFPKGRYDLIHSHYWISGQVGWLAAERWKIPLVHTMHTMAKVKNLALAENEKPEPVARAIGEEQVVNAASALIANTDAEAANLVGLYNACPDLVHVVSPGVDLQRFSPGGGKREARTRLGLPKDAQILTFVGRLQPHKGPEVLIRTAAELLTHDQSLRLAASQEAGDRCCVWEMEESCCKAESTSGERKKDHLQIIASQHSAGV
jgi:D-inositol-3-phosphate glycosyltransferase